MPRPAIYRPLLFTTTIRSPERLKDFLNVLQTYNGKILNDKLAEEIAGEIIRTGLYRPTKIPKNIKQKMRENNRLSDKEVKITKRQVSAKAGHLVLILGSNLQKNWDLCFIALERK